MEFFIAILTILVLAFFQIPLLLAFLGFGLLLSLFTWVHGFNILMLLVWLVFLNAMLFFNVPSLRRRYLTQKILTQVQNRLPTISKTEQEALDAGDVWWEKELFCGQPNWQQFLQIPEPSLSAAEQAFLANQVVTLCAMLDDWKIVHEDHDLPQEVWNYLKKERFFGLVIPKEYSGHGFSAYAHSTIILQIATRSYSAAVDIMVPNSVGLAEFLLLHGTEQQKQYFLPRFARGEEIPCFALTGPEAGSDAGAMLDSGVVCYDDWQGERILGIRLNWEKRYITLAPVATMIGLAFKMYDPDHLLGTQTDIGITLAMIPRQQPGISIGARHLPLFMAFLNGPIYGKDVFIPLDWLIGGAKMRGKGWAMMMECLSVGRGISLPALSTATAKLAYRMTSAYVKLRQQFHVSIGCFEGIKESLARIGAFTYLCEATRMFTASAIDQNIKPAIATAISKYHLTELSRKILNDAMDIHGGRTIQLGPLNYLAHYYVASPINITVEGANILTRNLIIFGQGALRCHPYIQKEIVAIHQQDPKLRLHHFDRLFFKHLGYLLRNGVRTFFYGITGGRWIRVPVRGGVAKYYRQLTRMSSALALVSDMALGVLGGKLKQRERLSARLGDVLSYLYLGSAVLKYYQDHDKPAGDLCFVEWILTYCLNQIQNALAGFLTNFPKPILASFVAKIIFPWGKNYRVPLDAQDHCIANAMMQLTELRERLTQYVYLGSENDICYCMEKALQEMYAVESAYAKLSGFKKGEISSENSLVAHLNAARDANIISDEEVSLLLKFEQQRSEVIKVDEFDNKED
jgi:acyl-CoA dehydrogenase